MQISKSKPKKISILCTFKYFILISRPPQQKQKGSRVRNPRGDYDAKVPYWMSYAKVQFHDTIPLKLVSYLQRWQQGGMWRDCTLNCCSVSV